MDLCDLAVPWATGVQRHIKAFYEQVWKEPHCFHECKQGMLMKLANDFKELITVKRHLEKHTQKIPND